MESALESDDEFFIGYCKEHSKTPRALFHINHINRLLAMANLPTYRRINNTNFYEISNGTGYRFPNFAPIHNENMTLLLQRIKDIKEEKNVKKDMMFVNERY